MTDPERHRSAAWEDPLAGAVAARSLSGLDFLRAIVEGELPAPPIAGLMGLRVEEVDEGRAVFTVHPGEERGGARRVGRHAAGLGAGVTGRPAGVGYTTLQLDVTYLRTMTADTGPVGAEARLTHLADGSPPPRGT